MEIAGSLADGSLSSSIVLQTRVIDGLTFSFVNEDEFRELYNEIFKVNQYIFSSRVASPFILDCGANIGVSVLYFKKYYPRARIIAFEPNPDTFRLLELNVRQNHLQGVELVNAALASGEDEIEFYVGADDAHPRSLGDNGIKNAPARPGATRTIRVPAVRLSSYVTRLVDLVKIDIEGMEEIVLREIENKLSLVEEIRLEFHHNAANPANDLDQTLALLARNYFYTAFERGRKVISPRRIRREIRRTNPYQFIIYAHRSRRHVWWQSSIVPKVVRVQNRIRRLRSEVEDE